MRHVGFPTLLFCSMLKELQRKIGNEEVWEGKKSGREAISRVEKVLQNGMWITPIRQALPKLQGFEH